MVVIWFRKTDLRFLEITPASNSQASPSSDPWLGAQKKSEPGELIKRDVARIDGELIGNHQFNTMFFHFSPYLAYLPMLYGIPTISTHGSPLVVHTQKPGIAGTSPVATLRPWSCGSKPCNRRPWRWLFGDDACWFCALNMFLYCHFYYYHYHYYYHCYNYYC